MKRRRLLRKNDETLRGSGENPFEHPEYSKFVVNCLRKLHAGEADANEQKKALDYIIYQVCGTYDLPYRPDDRDTIFACGKQHVGQTLVWLLNEAPTTITKASLDKKSARKAGDKSNVDE